MGLPRRVVHTVWALARSCHPLPVLGVTSLVMTLAVALDAPSDRLAVLTGAAFSGQLLVGWTNDLIDRDRDRAQGRTDKPLARREVGTGAVAVASAVALAACIPLTLALGTTPALAHFVAIAMALLYNAGLKATVWSWLPFAVSFGLLPVVVWTALPPYDAPPPWAVAAAVLLAVGAHGANVIPDRVDDLNAGVRPLPHRLPPAVARGLTVLFFLGGATVLLAGTLTGQ